MMEVDVLDFKGKKVGTAELPERIFEAPINVDLMHQAYVRQMANARLGTHKTRTRAEVRGGGRKPWRQKGTGRARHGTIRSPIWVGGGKVHTPRPRDYTLRMPQKMRRAALRSALSVKAADSQIVCVENLALEEVKTRRAAEAIQAVAGDASVLVLVPDKSEASQQFRRAVQNLPGVKAILAHYVNVRDLLSHDRLILPLGALEALSSFLDQAGGSQK